MLLLSRLAENFYHYPLLFNYELPNKTCLKSYEWGIELPLCVDTWYHVEDLPRMMANSKGLQDSEGNLCY